MLLHRCLHIGSIAHREEELVFSTWDLIGVGDDGRGSAVHDTEVQTWVTLRWTCWEMCLLCGGEVRLIARIIQLFLLSVSGWNSDREEGLLRDDVERLNLATVDDRCCVGFFRREAHGMKCICSVEWRLHLLQRDEAEEVRQVATSIAHHRLPHTRL